MENSAIIQATSTKNLKERRRSKNPIRRNINMKRKRSTKELEMEKHQKDMRKETERNTG